jgi:hypothetical protein
VEPKECSWSSGKYSYNQSFLDFEQLSRGKKYDFFCLFSCFLPNEPELLLGVLPQREKMTAYLGIAKTSGVINIKLPKLEYCTTM